VSARRDGAVVELLGAPGAGKSGLADALAALDGVTVVKDHSRGDLSALAWSMARSWPVAVAPPPDVDRRRWVSWAARVTAAQHVARHRMAHGARTVVFDQGAAYTLVRMMPLRERPHGSAWWTQRCVETASLLDLLVIVDADTPTLAKRLRGRHKPHHADGLDAESLHAYLDGERRDVHRVADALAREGAEVLRLVTTELTVERQVALVRRALGQRAPQAARSAG
jgi:hypothetical protein